MTPTKPRYDKEELARRGDIVYARDVAPKLKPGDKGKIAAIDTETGEFALAKDRLKACDRLRARIPDAQIWVVRVGYRAVHRFGGRLLREKP